LILLVVFIFLSVMSKGFLFKLFILGIIFKLLSCVMFFWIILLLIFTLVGMFLFLLQKYFFFCFIYSKVIKKDFDISVEILFKDLEALSIDENRLPSVSFIST
jgi:hypothetical protein